MCKSLTETLSESAIQPRHSATFFDTFRQHLCCLSVRQHLCCPSVRQHLCCPSVNPPRHYGLSQSRYVPNQKKI